MKGVKGHLASQERDAKMGSAAAGSNNGRMRAVILGLLCAQNAALALTTRYARGRLGLQFSTSVAVLVCEVVKLVFSFYMMARDPQSSDWSLSKTTPWLLATATPLLIPAGLYFVQNNIQFIALQNLPSHVFTVFSQLKILTSALFAVALLGRSLSPRKWRALILLVVGVSVIQSRPDLVSASKQKSMAVEQNAFVGTVAVLAQVTLSGIAGIYFEKLLKHHVDPERGRKPTLWERNVQLAFWAMPLSVLSIWFYEYDFLVEHGLFHDFTWVTWVVVMLYAAGGLLVALVVKYADTIIKGFAVTGSVVVTSVFGSFIVGDDLDILFVLGASSVVLAMFNYNEPEPSAAPQDGADKGAGEHKK